MKNKGFTLVELLGVIVVIAILSSLAVISINFVVSNGKNKVYKSHENTLKGAATDYLIENMEEVPNVSSNKKIDINTLINHKFVENLKDPNGGSCDSSYVLVTRGNDISHNFNLDYKVCLICTASNGEFTYKSKDC